VPEPFGPTEARWSGPFVSLRNVRYRQLWLGSMATFVGLRMHDVALGWLVLELTDSPFYLGLVDFARYLPLLFFPLLGGFLADTGDRRKIISVIVALGAIITAVLAVSIQLGRVSIGLILVLEFLAGCGFSIYFTVRQSVIAEVVEKRNLLNAFSLDFAGGSFVRILGPALAGMLIGLVGVASSLYLEVVSYVSAVFMFGRLRLQKGDRSSAGANIWQGFKQQWHFVRQNRDILNLMVLSAVVIPFAMSYRTLMPAIARDVLSTGPAGLGMLVGASGVGAVVAALALAGGHDLRHKGAIVLSAAGLFGVGLILLSLSRRFVPSLLLIAVGESMAAIYQTLYKVLIQDKTPDEFRGRMTGMYILIWGLLPLGSLLMGTVAERMGAAVAVGLGGTVCVLFTLAWGVGRSNLLELT